MASPAIHDGLVFIADSRKRVYCFDALKGDTLWTHDSPSDFWASPYVADGKIWIGDRRGTHWILDAGRKKSVLQRIDLGAPVSSTAVAANRTLYVASMDRLWAIAKTES